LVSLTAGVLACGGSCRVARATAWVIWSAAPFTSVPLLRSTVTRLIPGPLSPVIDEAPSIC
jgi:hypothetical protein